MFLNREFQNQLQRGNACDCKEIREVNPVINDLRRNGTFMLILSEIPVLISMPSLRHKVIGKYPDFTFRSFRNMHIKIESVIQSDSVLLLNILIL